ncbi:transcription factor RFX4-like [Ylistrum balloti]|uniref:transcription factor RFX4-like n=1 Tax=Ylistrum balloti TaxID=509963 RepID=UPI0029059126|nr:transcription factor RFX4-like [Ylistrum balloti]
MGDIPPTDDWFEHCVDEPKELDTTDEGGDNRDENTTSGFSDDIDAKLGTFAKLRSASKPHSTPQTLKWLEDNYEIAIGVCIPRSTLYYHYLDYCEKKDTQPVNAASFGKIIRQQFPQITTRRLGTRGQSKYHYYGIGVRESSIYYELIYSAKGIQSSAEGKKENVKQIIAYSPRSKLGTLLPEFPDIKDIQLPPNIAEEKVFTFMVMYRTHCQRILDTVIRANFDEVQSFLLHFWQGMPSHIVPILDYKTIVLLVGVCDSILYKAIANVLMPTVLQALPESLTQVIRRFAKQLDDWLQTALHSLPHGVQKIKFDLARRFAQVLRRQTSLNHLCQAARTVIHSAEITSQMLDDWLNVDLNSIIKQTLYTMDNYSEKEHQIIVNLCSEYEKLMEEQAPLESFIEWLDNMVDRCVVKPSRKKPGTLRQIARQFLLMWSCFGTRVIRDMTLHSAPSFGSFHLMHLMFDDYVLYLVENIHSQERANDFLRVIKGEASDCADEIILPDSSIIKESIIPGGSSTFTPTFSEDHTDTRDSVITNTRDIMGCHNRQSLSDSHTVVGCDTPSTEFDRPPDIGLQTGFTLQSSSSQCSTYAPPFIHQSIPNTGVQPPQDDVTSFGFNPRHIQVSIPSLHASPSHVLTPVSSCDGQRYTNTLDWNAQISHISQIDLPRMSDQTTIPQQPRPHTDHQSFLYYDNTQNTTRNYHSFTNDIQFPTSGGLHVENSGMTNSGKRPIEDHVTKSYKRQNRDPFSLQHQMEEGFI